MLNKSVLDSIISQYSNLELVRSEETYILLSYSLPERGKVSLYISRANVNFIVNCGTSFITMDVLNKIYAILQTIQEEAYD